LQSKHGPLYWRVADIRWESCYWHPGTFTFTLLQPVSNYRRFKNVQHPFKVQWDEYEATLDSWIANMKMDYKALPVEESRISVWYMFLMTHDSYLAQSPHLGMGTRFYDLMSESIDPSLPLKDRERAAKLGERVIEEIDPDLQIELHDLKFYLNKYADWLVRYVNG
jgi:hypothetical protein